MKIPVAVLNPKWVIYLICVCVGLTLLVIFLTGNVNVPLADSSNGCEVSCLSGCHGVLDGILLIFAEGVTH